MILTVIAGIIGILLIIAIILQNQGGGMSTTFGGSGEFYRSKRSIEKLLVWVTVGLTTLFAVVSIIALLHH